MIKTISLLKQCLQGSNFISQSLVRSIASRTDLELGSRMKSLNDNKQYRKVIELIDELKNRDIGHLSNMLITQSLKACAHTQDLQRGSMIRKFVDDRIVRDPSILASFVHFYMQCGDVTNAELLFNRSSKKTLFIYGAMIKGYLKNNEIHKAIDLYHTIKDPDEVIIMLLFNACARLSNDDGLNLMKKVSSTMPRSFHSNPKIQNTQFDVFIKCGDLTSAERIFGKMKKSVISYGNLMNAFNQDEQPDKTLELFHQMKSESIELNSIIYLLVINALAQTGVMSLSQTIVETMPKSFLSDMSIRNALIDMWGKNGAIEQAKEIFQNHPRPDKFTYTAMINAFAVNGMGVEALEIFRQMPLKFADEITYLCVLNACSHAGLVDQARSIFKDISNKTFKIYTAMVDCFSRAACFQEAEDLIKEYEQKGTPVYPMYMALLSGARNEKNAQVSQKIFNRMLKLFPELASCLTSASVLLANVYASSGHLDKATGIHSQLSKGRHRKETGLSWTAAKGQLCRFQAHDRSHPQTKQIYAELDRIFEELVKYGYECDSSWITRSLKDDETIASVLCGHSERLAIAWNFVVDPKATQIQITKNLRVCGDCHAATKLIAQIRKCHIIVRDANRIHHFFPNGQCSCQDYF